MKTAKFLNRRMLAVPAAVGTALVLSPAAYAATATTVEGQMDAYRERAEGVLGSGTGTAIMVAGGLALLAIVIYLIKRK